MQLTVSRQVITTVIILLLPVLLKAQLHKQKTIDSLLGAIANAKEDTNKVRLLNGLSFTYYSIDLKKGIVYGTQALQLAEKLQWKKGIERAYNALGANYWAEYDFIRAQDYYGRSLKIAQEIDDKQYIARALHDIGICYEVQNNYKKAIEYYKKSLEAFNAYGDKSGVIGCYSNIADVYMGHSQYAEAIKYYSKSLKISKEINSQRNIGYFYQQTGTVYSLMGINNKALDYQEEALRIFQKLNDYEDLAQNLNRQGIIYLKLKNYEKAILQDEAALNVLAKIQGAATKKMEAEFYASLATVYFEWAKALHEKGSTKRLQIAAENFQRSIAIAKAINYRESAVVALASLSDVDLLMANPSKALETYKEYITNRDSLSNTEKDKAYKSHELAFEYSKRQDSLSYVEKLEKQEIAQVKLLATTRLKQQSLYAIMIIVVLLFIVSYFFFRNRLQQIKFKGQLAKEKSEIEFKEMIFENKLNDLTLASLKSQMNPHFIFNCLNSIKFYIEKNETDAASLYITKFSKLIRNILDSARSEKITLANEIELIELYLEMEHMRLKDKLHYEFDIAKNIDIDFIEIPPLLIQPYVENAIWHGLMHKEKGGSIKIAMELSGDKKYLAISITDDGVGRDKAAEIKRKSNFQHTSHGSNLNTERISIFNAKYKTNTKVIITDLKDAANNASGTLITIKLLIQ
jgi:sensor histidine kinase YesM